MYDISDNLANGSLHIIYKQCKNCHHPIIVITDTIEFLDYLNNPKAFWKAYSTDCQYNPDTKEIICPECAMNQKG